MHPDDQHRDEQWEDLVRRLGGSPEQARAQPKQEEQSDIQSLSESPSEQFAGGMGARDYTLSEEDVEDFQPPDPKPVTTGSPRTVLSWFGVIGAIFLWILAGISGWVLPWWLSTVSIVALLVGAISLFFLLPKTWAHRDRFDDDDFGNGAKV